VAQRKRVGLITQRSKDRNLSVLHFFTFPMMEARKTNGEVSSAVTVVLLAEKKTFLFKKLSF
jgi:hypothetical protein